MRTAFAVALSVVAVAALVAAACSSTPTITAGTTFQGPSSVTSTWAQDRDLLFIANAGSDDLNAMNLCTQAFDAAGKLLPLPSGGPDPNTCIEREDQQILPGPIRVFPASVGVGDRPIRIAGARLLGPGDAPFGAVLVAGVDTAADGGTPGGPLIRLVDANNVLSLSNRTPGVTLRPPFDVALPSPAVDVVASEIPGHHVRAFAVSQGTVKDPAILTAFDVSALDGPPVFAPVLRCTLDLVATRLALVPGTDDLLPNEGGPAHVYVADGSPDAIPGGRGDGAVEVPVQQMPAFDAATLTPCLGVRRLPASDPTDTPRVARPLRSIALSPTFFRAASPANIAVPGGSILLGITLGSPALCGTPGAVNCGEGSVIIVQTNPGATSRVAPAPPADFFLAPAEAAAMTPLNSLAAAREVTFLHPGPNCAASPNACIDITAGLTTRIQPLSVQLAAVASTDDGGTVLINVVDRRFVDDLRDSGDPAFTAAPALSAPTFFPSAAANVASPVLAFAPTNPPPAGDPFTAAGFANPCPDVNTAGCLNKGVTRPLRWQLIWHGVFPGLESVLGNLTGTAGSPTVRLDFANRDLTPWITSSRLALQAGDLVHLNAFAAPAGLCPQLAAIPTTLDVPIQSVEAHALVITIPGFDPPQSCFGPVGVTVDVRTGPSPAGDWLVVAGLDVRGRVRQNDMFISRALRFDYPVDLPAVRPQLDIELAFAVLDPKPTIPGQTFTFTTSRGTQPTTVRETNLVVQGPVGDVFAYQSAHFSNQNIVFTALTGNNALLRVSPATIGNSAAALVVYR